MSIASSADGTNLVACAGGDVGASQIYTSSDYGVTWTPRESVRNWTSVAMSADGSRLAACDYTGRIYTHALRSRALSQTTAGTGGYLAGGQDTAVELQYIAGNTFVVLSHEGLLSAQ